MTKEYVPKRGKELLRMYYCDNYEYALNFSGTSFMDRPHRKGYIRPPDTANPKFHRAAYLGYKRGMMHRERYRKRERMKALLANDKTGQGPTYKLNK